MGLDPWHAKINSANQDIFSFSVRPFTTSVPASNCKHPLMRTDISKGQHHLDRYRDHIWNIISTHFGFSVFQNTELSAVGQNHLRARNELTGAESNSASFLQRRHATNPTTYIGLAWRRLKKRRDQANHANVSLVPLLGSSMAHPGRQLPVSQWEEVKPLLSSRFWPT